MKEIQLANTFLTLRPYIPTDMVKMFSAVRESFYELSPYMPWCHDDYSIEDSKNWIELSAKNWNEGSGYDFAITDSKDGSYLGSCSLNHVNSIDRWANLGYWVRTSRINHGIATDAVLLLSQFGFRELKFNKIEIVVAIENKTSQHVAEKVGAKQEGIMRNRLLLHGEVHDAVMFSLIPTDTMISLK